MRRFFLLLMLPIILFSFSSCSERNTVEPLKTIPTISELLEFSSTHSLEEYGVILQDVMASLGDISNEDLYSKIEESIYVWVNTQSLLELDEISIDFVQSLLLHEDKNQKRSNTILVKIDIFYDVNSIVNPEYELIYEIFEQIIEAVRGTTYGRFMVYSIELNYFDINNRDKQRNQLYDEFNEIADAKQPENEYYIQSLAYEYVRDFNEAEFSDERYSPYGEVTLRRFGVRSETDELYIEIPIYTLGYRDSSEREIFISNLEGRSKDLYSLLLSDTSATEYLKSKTVSTITISFWTLWEAKGKSYYTFSYDLKDY